MSAEFLVDSSVDIAGILGVSSSVIGLVVVALGTSLPELSVGVSSIKKGLPNILLGNIVGSNIANLLVVVGVASIVNPLPVELNAIKYTIPFAVIMTFLFFVFIRTGKRISRGEGLVLLGGYIGFIVASLILFF